MSSHGNYIVKVKWTSQKFLSSLAKLTINGIDRIGIASDITTVISEELDVNIRKFFIETHDGIFEGDIELYVHSVKDLNNLIMNISKIKGVESVKRKEEIQN
jgi:GTP pyrophosphokinase